MLSIVTFKWAPPPGYRSIFLSEHVNVLARMVARHYPDPHRIICVTDDPAGLDSGIEYIPLWKDHANVPSPLGPRGPSCYRRLRAFAPDAAKFFGERFVSLDLDTVIVGDMRPIWNRPDDFVIWGDTAIGTPYNGSMFLLRAGSRPQVWQKFHPIDSPMLTRKLGYIGSDQAWIAACLGKNEAKWTKRDGIYSFRNEIAPNRGALPADAKAVMFHGRIDPWGKEGQSLEWIRAAWR